MTCPHKHTKTLTRELIIGKDVHISTTVNCEGCCTQIIKSVVEEKR